MSLPAVSGWVGSLLLAALLAANWCFSSPMASVAAQMPVVHIERCF